VASRVDATTKVTEAGDEVLHQGPGRFGPDRFLNRELSWLDFAGRLLDLAAEGRRPLLERVKFLAIFSTGCDEFFQVRVAGLKDQVEAGLRKRSADGRSATEQLRAIRDKARSLVARQSAIFTEEVRPALEAAGICIRDYAALDEGAKGRLAELFEEEIYPVLTPLAVDPGHPFPYISSLSLNLAVVVEDPRRHLRRFARLKIPSLLSRFVTVPGGAQLVPLEQVIAGNLAHLFPDMHVGDHYLFRVTRNADFDLEESEADDLLAAVEVELRRRRFGRAVRLEVEPSMSSEVLDLLVGELELSADDVYAPAAPLDLGQLWEIAVLDRPELQEPPWAPMTPPRLATAGDEPVDLFAVVRERDVLVHHPYDSFATSVEAFLAQAAADPDVLAIKQTLYRTSGDATIVAALARAAEEGKQVAALVEVKARFDEQRNIVWARQLEQAGVHVVYGVVGLKTHSKVLLVVRREEDGIRCYCHVGTGNYNADTARVYEDLGLFSADPALGEDLIDLFNHLTGFSRPTRARLLVVAPERLRSWFLEQVATEAAAGEAGRVVVKCNGLTDPEVIDALYRASQAGVQIDLVVRSVCSLRPGVSGLSETIRVRSLVDRYLEHSRIYRFGEPPKARYFIGSADLMERNLDRRIEALVPVVDPELCDRLEDILGLVLEDDTSTWELGPDGTWTRVPEVKGCSAQRRLQELALQRARRRRSPEGLA
jgi:polyphosphate kinase